MIMFSSGSLEMTTSVHGPSVRSDQRETTDTPTLTVDRAVGAPCGRLCQHLDVGATVDSRGRDGSHCGEDAGEEACRELHVEERNMEEV